MAATLTIVLPVFGLILIGYLVGRTRLLTEAGIDALMTFVFYVAIPVLLFRTIGRIRTPDGLHPELLFAYYGAAFVVYALGMLVSRLVYRHGFEEQAMFGMACVYGNNVMLGLALVFTAFGERGAVPLMLIIAFHPTLLMSLPTVLIEAARGQARGGDRWRAWVVGPALALVTNPIIVSMVAGAAWAATGWTLPTPVDRTVELLGRPATPLALFALGASLTRFRVAGDLNQVAIVVAIKLFVFPAAVWLAATEIFTVDPFSAGIAAIMAAMPTGATVFVLANRYQVFVARAAAAVLIGTALAWITAALLIAHVA
jgi:malonate transporter